MIFSYLDYVAMSHANRELMWLNTWELIDLTIKISTLDDPYYMDLPPKTYQATLAS